MDDDRIDVTRLIKDQRLMTSRTWERLESHGFTDGGELQLDFFYAAPTNGRAMELRRFLEEETDYDVLVTADQDQWIVRGHTQKSPLSLSVVQQWVEWMIAAGLRFECVFDGWGAEVP